MSCCQLDVIKLNKFAAIVLCVSISPSKYTVTNEQMHVDCINLTLVSGEMFFLPVRIWQDPAPEAPLALVRWFCSPDTD